MHGAGDYFSIYKCKRKGSELYFMGMMDDRAAEEDFFFFFQKTVTGILVSPSGAKQMAVDQGKKRGVNMTLDYESYIVICIRKDKWREAKRDRIASLF